MSNPAKTAQPVATSPAQTAGQVNKAILSLSLAGLFIGTGEFASMSLLPGLADSTSVSIPTAGRYISAYALGVVVGAPLIAILAAGWPRKQLLILLIGLFAIGYTASAIAWNQPSLLVARFVAGLPHGAYYGVACLVAAALAGADRKAQAAGYFMAGLAAANVIGVPAATWLGQTFGWRSAFAVLGASGIAMMLLFWRCLPSVMKRSGSHRSSELRGLRSPHIWLTLATASVGFGGMFAVYSYITPTLTEVGGFTESQVPPILMLWGLGMVAGNLIGGWLADRQLVRTLFAIMVWNVIVLGLFSVFAGTPTAALAVLFLIGCGFALVPALQVYLMTIAGKAQTLAAALNHSAFNISNAIGASLGGLAISSGYGWASTGWIGSVLALIGIGLMGMTVWVRHITRDSE